MLKATALMLCLALPVAAAPVSTVLKSDPLKAEIVEVQARPNPAGTIIGDAIGGAVVGGAIGAGVAAWNRYETTNGTWDNWQRDVLVGAGIGLGVGLIVGGISAASYADHSAMSPVVDHRDSGFSPPMGAYGGKF